jgi:hypothetical protein
MLTITTIQKAKTSIIAEEDRLVPAFTNGRQNVPGEYEQLHFLLEKFIKEEKQCQKTH